MKVNNCREFLKQAAVAGVSAMIVPALSGCTKQSQSESSHEHYEEQTLTLESRLIVPKAQGLKITGTFLDEISHDIPHQNWGEKEWDKNLC